MPKTLTLQFELYNLEGSKVLCKGSIDAVKLLNPHTLAYISRELALYQTPTILQFFTMEGRQRIPAGVPILLIVKADLADSLERFGAFWSATL